jgi:hypothetical protein
MSKEPEFAQEAQEDSFHPAPTLLENGCMAICAVGIVVMGLIALVFIYNTFAGGGLNFSYR